MKLGELLNLKLYDTNEQVLILSDDEGKANKLYEGSIWEIPSELKELEVVRVGAMTETKRKLWELNEYGWTVIWVMEEIRDTDIFHDNALTDEEIECFNAYLEDAKVDIAFGNSDWVDIYRKIVGDKVSDYALEKMRKYGSE